MIHSKDCRLILPLTWREKNRLLARIDKEGPNGCWLWKGCTTSTGYGKIFLRHQVWMVHRIMHELFVRHVEENEVVDHLCSNPLCCNPEHLEGVVQAINVRRGNIARGDVHYKRRATHCVYGHLFSGDNLIWVKAGKYMTRDCRLCRQRRSRMKEFNSRFVDRVVEFWSNLGAEQFEYYDAWCCCPPKPSRNWY